MISAQSAERRNKKLKQFQSVGDDSSLTDNVEDTSDSIQEDDAEETVVGRTRDEVAKVLRFKSGKQFDRMKAVIKKVDELKAQGQTKDAELFLAVLNHSPLAAHDLMNVDLEALTDEDHEDIRTGKKAPRQFLPDKTKGKPKKEAPHKKALSEIREIEKSAKGIAKALSQVDNKSERSKYMLHFKNRS